MWLTRASLSWQLARRNRCIKGLPWGDDQRRRAVVSGHASLTRRLHELGYKTSLTTRQAHTTSDASPLAHAQFALVITNNMLAPEFRHDDRVIIDPDIEPARGDFVVEKSTGGDLTFVAIEQVSDASKIAGVMVGRRRRRQR